MDQRGRPPLPDSSGHGLCHSAWTGNHDYACSGESLCRLEHPALLDRRRRMRFYATGITPTHDNQNPKRHAAAWADRKRRTAIGRAMFKGRFPEIEVEKYAVPELRGMEGIRVRTFYAQLGLHYGVTWKGRDYDKSNWNLADNINRAVSAATASLYALCSAVISSMGYLPQLGSIQEGGTLPFVSTTSLTFTNTKPRCPPPFRLSGKPAGRRGIHSLPPQAANRGYATPPTPAAGSRRPVCRTIPDRSLSREVQPPPRSARVMLGTYHSRKATVPRETGSSA